MAEASSPGSSLDEGRSAALDVLDEAAELVSPAAAPRRFFAHLEHISEPYELGAAVSFEAEGRRAPSLLVYYNPRTRQEGGRRRMLRSLQALGLPTELAAEIFDLVPAARAGTVLAVTWTAAERLPTATIYLEEIARFWPAPEAVALTARLAALVGGSPPRREAERVGTPYIWAFDITPAGDGTFKVYRSADSSARAEVRAELLAHLGGADLPHYLAALLFGDSEPPPSYILQRRYDPLGRPAIHKIYRCFSGYEQGDAEPSCRRLEALLDAVDPPTPEEREIAELLLARDAAGRRRFRPTSISAAFAPRQREPRYCTGYFCLHRCADQR